MRKIGIPPYFANWIEAFLSGRTTFFSVNNGIKGPMYLLSRGVPQGSALSPILFIIFTTDLLDCMAKICPTFGYVDDSSNWITSTSIKENLLTFHKVIEVALLWGQNNGQTFSPSKTEIIHFCGKKRRIENVVDFNKPLAFNNGHLVHPSSSVRIFRFLI